MKDRLIYIFVLVPVLLVVFTLHVKQIQPFESFSLRFNDINFDIQDKKPNDNIVFVAVDEPSVNVYGRWPWDRDVLAKGVEKLYEADVVLFDIIFSEITSDDKDTILSESILSLKSSVCGFFLRENSTQSIDDNQRDILSNSSLDLLQLQISEHKNPKFFHAPFAEMNILQIMESCTLSGSFSTITEGDHLMRSYPIAVYFEDTLYPSLGVQGLRIFQNKDIERFSENQLSFNGKNIWLNEQGLTRLNFYKNNDYKIVSFLDVVNGKVKPEYFKNKIVILGITEVGAGDVVSTPMGMMPGPLLHYTFISNFLENHLIVEPKYITSALICLMGLLPFFVLLLVRKIIYRVTINVIIYLAILIFIKYIFVYQMIYIDMFYPLLALILSLSSVEAIAFNRQEKKGAFLRDAFSSYLSADLLNKLIENPDSLKLGGETKRVSILFSDIREFTSISESMEASKLITLLNRYFTPMTKSVIDNGGMLDKYIGDAIMSFFNAPVDIKNHADASCKCALDMIKKLELLNEELVLEGIKPINIGIGINTDEVVVGNMGSTERFNYTVIGDGVNLASRVESITKNYGVNILVTEFTVNELSKDFIYREIEPVQVKGKDNAVVVYELMNSTEESVKVKELYDRALKEYKSDSFEKAKDIFTTLVELYNDKPSKYFLDRLDKNYKWGINKMDSK